jgi:hypothetical protein
LWDGEACFTGGFSCLALDGATDVSWCHK